MKELGGHYSLLRDTPDSLDTRALMALLEPMVYRDGQGTQVSQGIQAIQGILVIQAIPVSVVSVEPIPVPQGSPDTLQMFPVLLDSLDILDSRVTPVSLGSPDTLLHLRELPGSLGSQDIPGSQGSQGSQVFPGGQA